MKKIEPTSTSPLPIMKTGQRFTLKVKKNGQIVIPAYVLRDYGYTPGDRFEINLGSKHIRLVQVDCDSDDAYASFAMSEIANFLAPLF